MVKLNNKKDEYDILKNKQYNVIIEENQNWQELYKLKEDNEKLNEELTKIKLEKDI